MENYSKQKLLQIIKCYDQYIVDWFLDEDHEEGEQPVCIQEFADFEYQEMLEAGYTDYNEYMSFTEEA